ncbi:hypothetical protein BO99DRAFT_434420 [Aspergillus violaceofuscus CBS 115571]|uniref:Uncharacterized protein n=1 Tax=Aspergillus violaceofuscus (strain CBS 115571) TaxID=1450538 RepID=A0A2V5HMS9_ASPV1|nr:hypothetical protein BO99DRAFT_434420 [Aspergillus violaceofuscus CBS 115571]
MLYQFNDPCVARYVWPEGIDGDTTGRHSGIIPTDRVPDTIKWENALRHTETVTLGRKSWKYANREEFESCMTKQDHILRTLTMHLYFRTHATDSLWISYTTQAKQYYFIGGKQYASRSESAVTARLQSQRIPIPSFTGWFPGQTWSEFVGEILAIMLGQLACNFRHEVQDQEGLPCRFLRLPDLHCPGILSSEPDPTGTCEGLFGS